LAASSASAPATRRRSKLHREGLFYRVIGCNVGLSKNTLDRAKRRRVAQLEEVCGPGAQRAILGKVAAGRRISQRGGVARASPAEALSRTGGSPSRPGVLAKAFSAAVFASLEQVYRSSPWCWVVCERCPH